MFDSKPTSEPRTETWVHLFLGVFLLGWSIFVLWQDGKFFTNLARDLAASGHPTVVATVTRSEIVSGVQSGRLSVSYNHPFKVLYLYEVSGRKYAGETFRHGMLAGGADSARAVQSRYAAGKRIPVHYNPADPADSVMVAGLDGADLLALLFMTPFHVAMLAGWWAAVYMARGLARSRDLRLGCPSPVTRMLHRDLTVRLRLAHAGPMVVFLWVLFAGPFGLVLAVVFASGGDITIAWMAVAWALLLAAAIGAAKWQAKRVAAGRYDFVVNHGQRVLALPTAFRDKKDGRWPKMGELALRNIIDVRVAAHQERDSEGDMVTYHEPMITHLNGVMGEEVLRVRTRTSEEHAKVIVDNLRRELGLGTA
jgi:hypothetical protein